MSKERIDVFISSTSIDLPDYRAAVQQAILSLGLFPVGMENWPVSGENPVDLCRQKVESAEIYLGIYAHRYGWRPDGPGTKSITEMEYDWAESVQRSGKPIPRLCFIMHDDYPWPRSKMELDAQADLDAFKTRVKQDHVGFFTTPDDLKAQVATALASYAHPNAIPQIQVPASYLRRLHNQCMQSDLLNALQPRDPNSEFKAIKIEQVYTPLDTRHGASLMGAADRSSRLVLLGDPGSGKSTFLKFLVLCLTGHMLDPKVGWLDKLKAQHWTHGEHVPIIVTLRDFVQDIPSDAKQGTAKLLSDHIKRQLGKLDEADPFPALKAALDKGSALVLLDGLDEVPDDRRELVRQMVADLIGSCHPTNRYIVTCRILSYINPAWKLGGMTEATIAPLDKAKANQFITAWYTAMQALKYITLDLARVRIVDLTATLDNRQLHDMASNPMLLTVMAIVHNYTGTLPREAARLYYQCVELLLFRWKQKAADNLLLQLSVTEDILYRLLWKIAYEAHSQQGDRQGAADISEGVILGLARQRFNNDLSKAELFCNYVYDRSGLLHGRGEDAYGLRVFTFPHRTFQEYLAGCHLASDKFYKQAVKHVRLGKTWRDVLLLATGHLRFNDSRITDTLEAVDNMLKSIPPIPSDADWQVVWLAADMLALVGLESIRENEEGPEILARAQTQLAQLVSEGHLSSIERAAAGRTLDTLGDPRAGVGLRSDGLPDLLWCEVPAGKCKLGSEKDDDNPPRTVYIDQFWITKYPITYRQFQGFMDDPDGYYNTTWWSRLHSDALKQQKDGPRYQAFKYWNHPRETVSWYEAMAFCAWLTDKLGVKVTLPTENQWEKAARGTDGREYSYGNDFDAGKANTHETRIGMTSAVGIFPDDTLPYGVMDMTGNVLEWCLNEHASGDINIGSGETPILRGGSWYDNLDNARASSRYRYAPYNGINSLGFRIVVGLRPPSLAT